MINCKKAVQKQGKSNKKYEAEHTYWAVIANSDRVSLKEAEITDGLPIDA
ncbi:MAG TPA: hypothetical protein VK093_00210 [Candidatus Avipropionibacterium sp.]|nr:hypothetical protein [Candidatus Avipropionibacterium sp.]